MNIEQKALLYDILTAIQERDMNYTYHEELKEKVVKIYFNETNTLIVDFKQKMYIFNETKNLSINFCIAIEEIMKQIKI